MSIRIGDLRVGGDAPVAIIAEIGNAHNGDYGRAIRLIDAAKASGASAVKLQCYSPDELIALRGDGPAPSPWGEQGWTMRALYEKARTPFEWFAPLYAHAATFGLPIFSSVFGAESLALLGSIGNPCYKIARLDADAATLIAAAKATGKPVIASAGDDDGFDPIPDALLWCKEGYPQADIRFRRRMFDDWATRSYDGFSYHGTDPLPCVVAATLGASIIEAHFMLDDEPSELEANVSLTASQFASMVRDIRCVERILA